MSTGEQEVFHKQAESLTARAERGESVAEELNKMPFRDRLKMAKEMEQINKEHIANPENPDNPMQRKEGHYPELHLETSKQWGTGEEHLMDIKRVGDPKAWLFHDKGSVYDLPKPVQHKWQDYLMNTQLTRDALYDKTLMKGPNGDVLYTSALDQ